MLESMHDKKQIYTLLIKMTFFVDDSDEKRSQRSIDVKLVNKCQNYDPLTQYTACTLKLRPVKLLFVIFGRLSYSFFLNVMVWGNGRLSYLILKNHPFFNEK